MTTTTLAPTERQPEAPTADPPKPPSRRFRPDIEGLRAFAVLAVVLYHAHLAVRGGFVGVDVFFVISGFLITRQLMGSVGAGGIRALPGFYTRRIRRLLPASFVVVVATLLAVWKWVPALHVKSIATDGIYTAFYGLNYRLAHEGTQYLHAGDTPSPFQHFWSLGVEEQFYLLWPILIVLTVWLGRRYRIVLLATILSCIVAGSLLLSITETPHNSSWAYFGLPTRAWELALGGLVAVGAERLSRLPGWLAHPGSVLGMLAVVGSAFLLSDSTLYPGYAAALPVVGAAVVLACGCGRRTAVESVLAEPVLQGIGKVSYSWYLWHWPMLIIAPYIAGRALEAPRRAEIVLLSLTAAVLSYFIVENPIRGLPRTSFEWFRTGGLLSSGIVIAGIVVIGTVPVLAGTGLASHVIQAQKASPQVVAAYQKELALALGVSQVPRNLTPTVTAAAKDLPPSSENGCHADFLTINQGPCVFGDAAGTHTVLLFGDSHMEQWLPAMIAAANTMHWRVVNWTKAACPVAMLSVYSPDLKRNYPECDRWRSQTLQKISALKPDLVIAGQSDNVPGNGISDHAWAADTLKTLKTLSKSAKRVDMMLDTPLPGFVVPDCVAAHLTDFKACNYPRAKDYGYPKRHAAMAAAVSSAGFTTVEPLNWLCARAGCPAIVGNLLVYRDQGHMTASFSRWLAPMLQPLLTTKA